MQMNTLSLLPLRGRFTACLVLLALAAPAYQCSRGALPGSPTPVGSVGGAARYRGTLTYTRVSGGFAIEPARQRLDLSIVLGAGDQLSGRFEAEGSTGSLQGAVQGTLSAGSFSATLLLSTQATAASGGRLCEGAAQVSGEFSGREVTWRASDVTYDNCPGLTAQSQADAEAISPVPGTYPGRANVAVTVLPSASVARSTCSSGSSGWPFTVVAAESGGIDVQLDATFTVEERSASGVPSRSVVETPFRTLGGGSQREYSVCAPSPGTYQAFFAGNDARGNRIRFASPLITFQ